MFKSVMKNVVLALGVVSVFALSGCVVYGGPRHRCSEVYVVRRCR